MNEELKPFPLLTLPGVQRDGTTFDASAWTDGQWIRFRRGRPRKMRGYRRIVGTLTGPVRAAHVWSRQTLNAVHTFSPSKVELTTVDADGVGAMVVNRTPAGFATNSDYTWTVDTMFDDAAGGQETLLIAHATTDLSNIDDPTETDVFVGDISTGAALAAISGVQASGGVVVANPYLILYGSDGRVQWSNANEPQNFTTGDSDEDRITGAKIVRGLPLRLGGGPAALLWSLDSVIQLAWVGGTTVFRASTLSAQSSILAKNSVIEYDGVYYWVGVDRFMMFNGRVQELPNQMSLDWFFDGLNYDHRQKIWATKVPRFGEVVWFYPRGAATECSHAVVFNVREGVWYDFELARSAGYYSQVFKYPVWTTASTEADTAAYAAYAHEVGWNAVAGAVSAAIPAWATTNDVGLLSGGGGGPKRAGLDAWTQLDRVEADFGEDCSAMELTVLGREFPSAADAAPLRAYNIASGEPFEDVREQARVMRLKFYCGGDESHFEFGNVMLHVRPGDERSG